MLYMFACMGLVFLFRWSCMICYSPMLMRPLRCGYSRYVMRRLRVDIGLCLPLGVAQEDCQWAQRVYASTALQGAATDCGCKNCAFYRLIVTQFKYL